MSTSKLHKLFGILIVTLCLSVIPLHAQAASKNKHKTEESTKERLVLMPLRIPEGDKNLMGAMETALVKGLQLKYDVYSGEQVSQKAHEIFMKESKNTAHKECDETKCMQNIAMAFQAELIATANVTKQDGTYFLALSIQNIFDNKVVYSESLPCRNCDAAQVVDKLKELSGAAERVARTPAISPQSESTPIAQAKQGIPKLPSETLSVEPEMIPIPGKNYEMGKYDVTQKEWRDIMGNNPSNFSGCGDTCPVEQVSWNDVQEFLQKLNAKTGKQYRLPIEEEWEYACYGGNKTEYCGSNDINSVAWYRKNSNTTMHPVGQKQANGYGLYDMSGNVCQWMQNEYGRGRALRGCSWISGSDESRAASRISGVPTVRSLITGFRLARTLP
jgi:formylglycine-generating enzyme required for sulfatase activity